MSIDPGQTAGEYPHVSPYGPTPFRVTESEKGAGPAMDRVDSHSTDWVRQLLVDDALPVVSSRRAALKRLRALVGQSEIGPVLITGEAGSGKTWLARRFAGELPTGWRAVTVDLGAAMNALEFLRLIGNSLGVTVGSRLGAARLRCQAVIEDEAAEGRRWLLVIDEAHRAAPDVWDEIQVIVNRQGRPGGFGAIFILGRTALARAFSTTSLSGLAPGLLTHVHLLPLDLDELRDLLGGAELIDERALEELHRDAQGNAGMLLRLVRTRSDVWRPGPVVAAPHRLSRPAVQVLERSRPAGLKLPDVPEKDAERTSHPAAERVLEAPSEAVASALIPTKPPLRVEDGLVEVGWDGDLATEFDETGTEPVTSAPFVADERPYHEEPIVDHYAALQARAEQTRNQARLADLAEESGAAPAETEHAQGAEPDEGTGGEELARRTSAESALPASGIRVEGQHEFAPYSQLFTRLRHSKP